MRLPEDFSGAKDDNHLVGLWLAGRPETTQALYRYTARLFFEFLTPRQTGMRDATVADLVAWIDTLTGAPASKVRHTEALKSLFSFAHRTGYTTFNVANAIRCPKLPDLVHERIVDEDVIRDVIKHATTPRDRALVLILYYSGARISEVCGLRFCDIRGLNVTFIHTKGTRTRTIPIPKFVIDALLVLRNPSDPDTTAVFRSFRNKPLSRMTAWYVVKKIADAAANEQMSPHWFRHAHASHTLDAGAPIHLVQRCLGHSNVATTSRYLHVKPGEGASRYLTPM